MSLPKHQEWRQNNLPGDPVDLRLPCVTWSTHEQSLEAGEACVRGDVPEMIPGLSQVTTAFDPSMAPEGHDTWWFWSGLVPARPNETWDVVRDKITDRVVKDCGRFYEGLEDLEIARRPLTPYDLEQRFRAPSGNVYHVDPIITRFGPARPAIGLAGYATPVPGLFLSGSGTHPIAGINGMPGMNAAKAVITALRKEGGRREAVASHREWDRAVDVADGEQAQIPDRSLTKEWGGLAQPIREDDPGEDKPAWKDNAYLCFWDPGNEVYGVVHVSTSPNAEGRRARASLSVDGRSAEVAEELEPGSFASDSISFGLDGRIEAQTPELTAALELTPRGEPGDYTKTDIVPPLVEGEPLQHFQGAVLVRGTVVVGDRSVEVDGVGMRDRTWGYRDESAAWPEYFGLIADIDGRLLTIMKLARTDGTARTAGFLLGDEPVRADELSGLTRDASGLFAAATVGTAEGETLEIRMTDRPAGFWVPMGWERQGPTMSAYDEFLTLRTADGKIGHGMVEQGIVRRLS